jgi:hypothetical protein
VAYGICGLKPSDLLDLTPRDVRVMVESIMQQKRNELQVFDVMNALLCSTVYNCQYATKDTPQPTRYHDFRVLAAGEGGPESKSPEELMRIMDLHKMARRR